MLILKGILVLTLVAIGDVIWALYIKHTSEGTAMKAGIAAVGTWAFSAFVTWTWLHDPRLVPFALCGAFLGTYAAVERKKDRQ